MADIIKSIQILKKTTNKVVRNLIPPVFFKLTRFFRIIYPSKLKNELFDGQSELFIRLVKNSTCYLEYGVGYSTLWVAENLNTNIFSVESARDWSDLIKEKVNFRDNIVIECVDLGKITDWGRPVDYSRRNDFLNYADLPWQKGYIPDLILIDGRFRVLCFLVAIKKAKPGTLLLFDDYTDREYYHLIEEYLQPIEINKRQALFKIPDDLKIDKNLLDSEIEKFSYVMD